jgi:CRP-like cAMP-binding protein
MKESEYLENQPQFVKNIRIIPAFSQFPDEKILDILKLCKLRIYDAGESIIEEGERAKHMFFLFSGGLQISKGGKPIAILRRAGDIFGEMALLDEEDETRTATVRAMSQTTCLAIDADLLKTLQNNGEQSFQLATYRMLTQILVHRLRETTENYTKARLQIDVLKKIPAG